MRHDAQQRNVQLFHTSLQRRRQCAGQVVEDQVGLLDVNVKFLAEAGDALGGDDAALRRIGDDEQMLPAVELRAERIYTQFGIPP